MNVHSAVTHDDRFILPNHGEILLYRIVDCGEECSGLDDAREDGVDFRASVFSVDSTDIEFYDDSGYLFVTEDYTGNMYLLKNPLLACIGQKGLSYE